MRKYTNILRYARPHALRFVALFVLTLVSSSVEALQPWPLKVLADHVLGGLPLPSALQRVFGALSLPTSPHSLLVVAALGVLALYAINSTLDIALTWGWTVAGRRMVYALAGDLFARLQRRSLWFHSHNSVGDVVSRITGDSWCVSEMLETVVFTPLHTALSTVAMIVIMAGFDLRLTSIAIMTAVGMAAGSALAGKPLRAIATLKREVESRMQSHVQQTLTGISVVQAFGQEEHEHRRFREFTETSIRLQKRAVLIGSLNNLGSGLVTTLGSGLILWLGARDVLRGRLEIGTLLVFAYYLNKLQGQFRTLAGTYTVLQKLRANIDRVNQVLDAPAEIADRPGAVALPRAKGLVQIEGVTFGYERDRPVLRGVSLEAKPGQTIAIVGPTGAGKSTLISLLPRFHDPWSGRVLLDGRDLRDLQLKSLRDQLAIMLQEPFLFPFSVAENIAFARPDAARAQIEAAARAANAHEFIMRLPEGYDTQLGEHGSTLSGGERQRLAIARALLRDAPVLILDEPTSALDVETEALLLEALERLMAGRTTFLIAHRLSTVRRANCIVVLQDGRIVERGRHEELLGSGGAYARLCKLQFQSNAPSGAGTGPKA